MSCLCRMQQMLLKVSYSTLILWDVMVQKLSSGRSRSQISVPFTLMYISMIG